MKRKPKSPRKIVRPEIGPRLPDHIEKKLKRHKTARNRCIALWAEAVKARAGYRSDLTGATGVLHAHHIVGRRGRAAVDLANGICLTAREHIYGVHHRNESTSAEWNLKVDEWLNDRWSRERLFELTKEMDYNCAEEEHRLREAILMFIGGPNG